MRRSFPFYDLGDEEFEELARHICMQVLGTGTFAFAVGQDGGRDGKFEGTAQKFPSQNSPRKGKFIIQAKHTTNPVASCSRREFSRLLDDEVPKIKKLIKAKEVDHYLVFTNRRKPASKAIEKEKELEKLGLETAYIFGDEQIRQWLTSHPQIWRQLGFDRFDRSFEIQPQDMTEIVSAFHAVIKGGVVKPTAGDFTYVDKRRKNTINGLTAEYDRYIRETSLVHFRSIEDFLKNPRNDGYKELYQDAADEIKKKIIVHSGMFETFDEALTYVFDLITQGNDALRRKRQYVSAFLHYMYYTCDIGQHARTVKAS